MIYAFSLVILVAFGGKKETAQERLEEKLRERFERDHYDNIKELWRPRILECTEHNVNGKAKNVADTIKTKDIGRFQKDFAKVRPSGKDFEHYFSKIVREILVDAFEHNSEDNKKPMTKEIMVNGKAHEMPEAHQTKRRSEKNFAAKNPKDEKINVRSFVDPCAEFDDPDYWEQERNRIRKRILEKHPSIADEELKDVLKRYDTTNP